MKKISFAKDGGIFQSALWKEFQTSLERPIFESEFFWGILQKSPILGCYGEVSRGPDQQDIEPQALAATLKELLTKKKLSFLRIEPQHEELLPAFKETGFRLTKAPLDVQPREIFLISIADSEEALVKAMKPKTRYNIRLAEKKGIVVRPIENDAEREAFLNLLEATAERKGISFHSKSYYRKFSEFFSGDRGQTFVALQNGKVLAGGIVAFFGSTAYYMHGGSSSEGRNAMAPHLLQWQQILFAKTKNCTQYDFGGVAIEHRVKGKDWSGITRFKTGFSPHTKSIVLPGTYDLVFSPLRYYGYQFFSRLKGFFI